MYKVTVIIAVLNAKDTIQRCLESIITQQGVAIELIVLDGGSTDGTQHIINSFATYIAFYESAKDGGIYNAWNKGLNLMSGDWVCFLGADDAFIDNDILASNIDYAILQRENVELILSNGMLVDNNGNKIRIFGEDWNWNKIIHYVKYCHPGLLHSNKLIQRVGNFDVNYKIAADYDYIMRCGKETKVFYIDKVSVCVGDSGVSRSKVSIAFSEHYKIQRIYMYITKRQASFDFLMAYLKYFIRSTMYKLGFK